MERQGRVTVTVVPDVTQRMLLAQTVRVVKRGALVYTDKYAGYDTLTFCGYRHLRVDHGRRFSRGKSAVIGPIIPWGVSERRCNEPCAR